MLSPRSHEHWLVRAWQAFDQWFFGPSGEPVKRHTGQDAEDIAARYLQAKGYSILERNWKWHRGELDIICLHNDRLVVVEVKSARADSAYHAADRVGRDKRRQLWKLTEHFMKQRRWLGRSVQVDIVEVTFQENGQPVIRHLEADVRDPRR
jgi:putative endonuclease